jgi:hypothetical protein
MEEDRDNFAVELMYEGNDRDVFEKLLRLKFEGDKDSVRSLLSIPYHMAMFDSLVILKDRVNNGDTAIKALEAIVEVISNVMVATIINVYPKELQEDTMKMFLVGLVKTMPAFLANSASEVERHENGAKDEPRH